MDFYRYVALYELDNKYISSENPFTQVPSSRLRHKNPLMNCRKQQWEQMLNNINPSQEFGYLVLF
jgi:hypothetical protein